ncbi:MAG: hypothetical protein ACYTGL_30240 [Planctomycetota bacterium]
MAASVSGAAACARHIPNNRKECESSNQHSDHNADEPDAAAGWTPVMGRQPIGQTFNHLPLLGFRRQEEEVRRCPLVIAEYSEPRLSLVVVAG